MANENTPQTETTTAKTFVVPTPNPGESLTVIIDSGEVPQINLFSNKTMVSVYRTNRIEGWLTDYKGAIGATYVGGPLSAHQLYQLRPIQ